MRTSNILESLQDFLITIQKFSFHQFSFGKVQYICLTYIEHHYLLKSCNEILISLFNFCSKAMVDSDPVEKFLYLVFFFLLNRKFSELQIEAQTCFSVFLLQVLHYYTVDFLFSEKFVWLKLPFFLARTALILVTYGNSV